MRAGGREGGRAGGEGGRAPERADRRTGVAHGSVHRRPPTPKIHKHRPLSYTRGHPHAMKSARPMNIAKSTRYAERIRRFDVSVWNFRSSDRGWNQSSQSIERGSSSVVDIGPAGDFTTFTTDSLPSTRFGLIQLRHRTPRAWHATPQLGDANARRQVERRFVSVLFSRRPSFTPLLLAHPTGIPTATVV